MKWKLFRRKMTISAPRVSVRTRLPWPVRAMLGFVVLAAAAAAGVAVYEYGRHFAGPDRRELVAEIGKLSSQVRELSSDRDRFAALATAYESQLKVERAAQEQLARQVSALEGESNRLREDLAFFESLLPAGTGNKGVVIRSFRVQPEGAPNQMRYRLLVQQSGKPDRDFVGHVQMQIHFAQGGRTFTLTVPNPAAVASGADGLGLSFRHYQRVEGTFALPEGAVPRSVQVRIMAGGETQTQQTFTL
jgi:outer membrane murein-binding lipoprotein Lpp